MTTSRFSVLALMFVTCSGLHADDKYPIASPATIGRLYAYVLTTNKPAYFEKSDGNAAWLGVTPEGLLTGTPPPEAPRESTITVNTYLRDAAGNPERNHTYLTRTFIVAVQDNSCADTAPDQLAWCDDAVSLPHPEAAVSNDRRPPPASRFGFAPQEAGSEAGPEVDEDPNCTQVNGNGCIVQFDRLLPQHGGLGHYVPHTHHIEWMEAPFSGLDQKPLAFAVMNAINGSNALVAGSVLIHTGVDSCSYWSWSVVTQTMDSSNNLIYGPNELSVFCAGDGTVIIVLPSHAIWAHAYGSPAETQNPLWKPASAPAPARACNDGSEIPAHRPALLESRGIRPCRSKADNGVFDEQIDQWYTRVTQPGVSQGGISISPIDPKTKSTWDVQGYESWLHGPGWLGTQGMFERDRSATDDLNSFTLALTYDLHSAGSPGVERWFGKVAPCIPPLLDGEDCTPPLIAVRPLEIQLRTGIEYSPESFKYKWKPKSNSANSPPMCAASSTCPDTQYLGRDFSTVEAATFRLPVAFSPRSNAPSLFTIAPILGPEIGYRVKTHPIRMGVIGPQKVAPQPDAILRGVVGGDLSVRAPFLLGRDYFGTRPMTLDYSYRARYLAFAEPFANEIESQYNVKAVASGQSLGQRTYQRITFINPVSAYVQMRITWQHGSLPPLFQYVNNQVTFGLTYSNPGSAEH